MADRSWSSRLHPEAFTRSVRLPLDLKPSVFAFPYDCSLLFCVEGRDSSNFTLLKSNPVKFSPGPPVRDFDPHKPVFEVSPACGSARLTLPKELRSYYWIYDQSIASRESRRSAESKNKGKQCRITSCACFIPSGMPGPCMYRRGRVN